MTNDDSPHRLADVDARAQAVTSVLDASMNPEAAAELVRILGRVDELRARLLAVTKKPVAAGTLAAADDVIPEARFVSIHATQSLVMALDHLLAWRLLVAGGSVPFQAQMTLLRSALEGSIRGRWLVDPSLDSLTRVGRGYAAKRDDFLERQRFEECREHSQPDARPKGGKSAAERLAELDAKQSASAVPMVRFDYTTTLMKTYGYELWYRLLSAAAHGKEWVFGAAIIVPSPDSGAPAGVIVGTATFSDDVILGLTRVTMNAVELALADLEAYGSHE